MCKDPALSYLNGLGYNVIRHPRANISPLYLIGRRNGVNEGLGSLDKLTKKSQRLTPRIIRNETGAAIAGKTTGNLDASVGLGILGAFLKATGLDIELSGHFGSVRKVKFSFNNVLVDRAEILDVGKFLDGAEADLGNPAVRAYLKPGGQLFVIHEVIKSNEISVLFHDSTKADLLLKLPALQKTLEGKASVGMQVDEQVVLKFSGREPLGFGFKCMQIWLKQEDGETTFELTPVAASPLVNFSTDSDGRSQLLLATDDLLNLVDDEPGAPASVGAPGE